MNTRRVLVTTPWLSNGSAIESILHGAGYEVNYLSAHSRSDEYELKMCYAESDAVIAGTEPIPAATLATASALKMIVRTGVGYDNIDVLAATKRGIAVCTTPGANRLSVAELVLGLIFNGARRISHNIDSVNQGRWQSDSGREIAGATLGIVGLGSIGKTVARLALSLGMTVIACDPYVDYQFAEETGVSYAPLDDVLSQSDFVSLHLLLNEANRHLIDAERLAMMKPTGYLINTSRGGVIDEHALKRALETNQLAGAALDVLEEEPFALTSQLRGLKNLVVTAHIAGATFESRSRSAVMAAQQIVDFFDGNELPGLVNPDYLAALTLEAK